MRIAIIFALIAIAVMLYLDAPVPRKTAPTDGVAGGRDARDVVDPAIQQSLGQYQAKTAALETSLREAQASGNDARDAALAAHAEAAETKRQLEAERQQRLLANKLQMRLNEQEKRFAALAKEKASLLATVASGNMAFADLQEQFGGAKMHAEELEKSIKILEEKLRAMSDELVGRNEAVGAQQRRADAIQLELADERRRVDVSEKERADLAKTLSDAQATVASLHTLSFRAQQQSDAAIAELNDAQKTMAARLRVAEFDSMRYCADVEHQRRRADELLARAQNADYRIQVLEETRADLVREAADAQATIAGLGSKLSAAQAQLVDANKKSASPHRTDDALSERERPLKDERAASPREHTEPARAATKKRQTAQLEGPASPERRLD